MTSFETSVNGPTPDQAHDERIERMRNDLAEKLRAAENAAYAFFVELPVGHTRTRAYDVYENIRNATRV